jgi:hypothetical protein
MKDALKTLLLFSISLLWQLHINAQVKRGQWIQRDVTIDYADNLNAYLSTYANATSYISDADGKHDPSGRYLFIKNNSSDTLFYRSSPKGLGDYVKKDALFFVATTSNMLQYHPVFPGSIELIDRNFYEDKYSRKMKMRMIVEFKFFRPDSLTNKPLRKITGQPSTPSDVASTSQKTIKASANNFYVFLSTRMEIPPAAGQFSSLQSSKILEIISRPMLHQGNLTDDLRIEKEFFIGEIENYRKEHNDELRKKLSANNYEKIAVHYGKPYSTMLLKTEEVGIEAINAFIQSEKELVSGIATIEFFQLK